MSFFDKLFNSGFQWNTTAQNLHQLDPYNLMWWLWLRRFNGDSQALLSQFQQINADLSTGEAQALLAQIREQTKWAMNEFYDVRDAKQTREQAIQAIRLLLPTIHEDNLNSLVAYCQYSSER